RAIRTASRLNSAVGLFVIVRLLDRSHALKKPALFRDKSIEDPVLADRISADLLSRYEDAVALTRPYPGVEAVLAGLRADGHRLAVCTNKPEAPALAVLRHLKLDGFFEVILGGDSGLPRKPDPAPLHESLRGLGAGPVAYIGDSEVDAATAEAAGVPFLLFTEGYRKTAPEDLPHLARFDDFAMLPGLIRDMG
ncbi:MAG: HAD-IA family hydrolase, partial [Paracoccus sp. (in: a-proteobacteria)]